MKQILQSKTGSIILAVLAGLVVAFAAWEYLGVGESFKVQGAIRDIASGNNVAKARTTLETLNDRAYVLEKLSEAVESDKYAIRGKANLLTTLSMFSQPRAVRRALESPSMTARRAACTLLWGDAELKTTCAEIALDWLKDTGADGRPTAAMICGQMNLEEAQPIFLEIVEHDPETVSERDVFSRALGAIKDPKPKELMDRLLKLAGDETADPNIRGIALETLQRSKDGPRDRILQLSIDILKNPDANLILRSKAAIGLRDFPEDRSWDALESVLVAELPKEEWILQRTCLYSLAQMSPEDKNVARRYLDKLRKLLTDRRVYNNPYYAMKVDVATTLCALNAREGITLDIMCNYLVDEDENDKDHLVRQEAWLTLWTLTGVRLPDIPQPELFQTPPPPFPDPLAAREFFVSRRRPGIKPEQSAVVKELAKDLSYMQKTRQIYQSKKAEILEQWRVEAEEKKAKAEAEGPPQVPVPGNVGPQAPRKEEEKGSGEEEPTKDEDKGSAEPTKDD